MLLNRLVLRRKSNAQDRHSNDRPFRLRVECLENRAVPATFTVNTTLDDLTPGDGKLSLREAITRANGSPGADVINLPAGVFKIALAGSGENGNATGDFDITDSLTVQGAGRGLTVVDGQQLDRVFEIRGTAPGSITGVLDGLTVRNGRGGGPGAGINVGNANLVGRDLAVTGNRTSTSGGGISNASAAGTGSITLVRTTLARNFSGSSGGGIFVQTSSLTIKNSTIRRNLTTGTGGGIYADALILKNSTIEGNTAAFHGGGITSLGTATITNSTVSGNWAGTTGGGISAASAAITNSTVSGNSAGTDGGGIHATTATLLNCTVVENSALSGGGLFRNPGSTVNVRNSIIALNVVATEGAGPDVSGIIISSGHNLISNPIGGTGFTNGVNGDRVGTAANPLDPKLGPLANNGGPTKTHALLAGSLAIDRGDSVNVPPTDQRGLPRRKDGNFDGVAIVDIGAFER